MNESIAIRRYYTVKEFHAELGGIISKGMVYKMIADGEIPTRKIGRKIAIPAVWVQTFIDTPGFLVKKVRKNKEDTDGQKNKG